jgi:hypothetical protein
MELRLWRISSERVIRLLLKTFQHLAPFYTFLNQKPSTTSFLCADLLKIEEKFLSNIFNLRKFTDYSVSNVNIM